MPLSSLQFDTRSPSLKNVPFMLFSSKAQYANHVLAKFTLNIVFRVKTQKKHEKLSEKILLISFYLSSSCIHHFRKTRNTRETML